MSIAIVILVLLLLSGLYYLLIQRRLQVPRWSLPQSFLQVQGLNRRFRYYRPDGISAVPALVFVLHGSKGSPGIMRYLTKPFLRPTHRSPPIMTVPRKDKRFR